jgi:hypothetical protein
LCGALILSVLLCAPVLILAFVGRVGTVSMLLLTGGVLVGTFLSAVALILGPSDEDLEDARPWLAAGLRDARAARYRQQSCAEYADRARARGRIQRPFSPAGAFVGLIVCFAALGLLTAIAFALYFRPSDAPNDGPSEFDAKYAAKDVVLRNLKAPSTAEFGGMYVTRDKAGVYEVGGWVDAQNSFGAKIRSRFVVRMTFALGTWRLVEEPIFLPWAM